MGLFDAGIFMQRAQMQQQERQNAYDRFAKSIALGQQQQAMDIQRRQLEAKGTEFDLKSTAQKAAMKLAMGQPISPEETAAIQTFDAFNTQAMFDPNTGGMIQKPPILDTLTGRMQAPIQQPMQQPVQDLSGLPALEDTPMARMPATPMIGGAVQGGQDSFSFDNYGGIGPQQSGQPPADYVLGENPFAQNYGGSALPQVPAELPQEPVKTPKLTITQDMNPLEKKAVRDENIRMAADALMEQEKLNIKKQDAMNYNEGQNNAASAANIMFESEKNLNQLGAKAQDAKRGWAGTAERFLSAIPSFGLTQDAGEALVKAAATPEQRKYMTAANNWILAKLRNESGATFGPKEIQQEYEVYFPMPGDDDEQLKTKARMRQEAQAGMIAKSAGAFQVHFGKKAQALNNQEAPKPARRKYDPATGRLVAQ